jgi:hypothetical protein
MSVEHIIGGAMLFVALHIALILALFPEKKD